MIRSSKELAKQLGVSPSAVSIALNGRNGISDKTRNKILEAVKEYGLTARRTRAAKGDPSRFIQLVVYKRHGMVFGDTPFFSSVIEGISAGAGSFGYKLLVSYFYPDQPHDEQIKSILSSGCAGAIILATEMLKEDTVFLSGIRVPFVILDSYYESGDFNCIAINNVQGAYRATSYLMENGHTEIGHIASSVDINNFRERHEGFVKAVSERGETKRCRGNIIGVSSTSEGAYKDMTEYLKSRPRLATAYFADNDIIAVSCIRALKEAGYKVPEEVSVIGFDNMAFSYVVSPKLTTMHVPKEELGIRAVNRLMELLEGKTGAVLKIEVCTQLVVRDSVAARK
jgi:DNA-binding LacI/PurR family transcriptional regulator